MSSSNEDPAPSQAAQAAQVDEGLASGNQSAINAYDRMLREKERVIRENIARKYNRIHEVERQLESLRLALHVNVGPRRQALEHLRSKIEQQNHKIDGHRTEYLKHKQLMEAAHAAMEREEALKNQMAEELNTLVQQSASAQLKKLEQLSDELEHLTTGMPSELSAAAAAGPPAPSSAAPAPAANGAGGEPPAGAATAAGSHAGQQQGGGSGAQAARGVASEDGQAAAAAASQQQQRDEAAERQRRQQERQAVEARGRHVQLGGRGARTPGSRIPQPPSPNPAGVSSGAATSGPFRGFD